VIAWTRPFTVPAGVRLKIALSTFGMAQFGTCSMQGFTEQKGGRASPAGACVPTDGSRKPLA